MGYDSVTQKLYEQWKTKQKNKEIIQDKINEVINYQLDNNFQSIIRTIVETESAPLKSTKIKVSNLTEGALMPVGYIYDSATALSFDKKYFPFIESSIVFNSETPFQTIVEVDSDSWDTDFFRIIQQNDGSTVLEGYFNPRDNLTQEEINNGNTNKWYPVKNHLYDIIPKKVFDDERMIADWKRPAYLCSIEWNGNVGDPDGVGPFKMDPALITQAQVSNDKPYYVMDYTAQPYTYTATITGGCNGGGTTAYFSEDGEDIVTTSTLYNGLGVPIEKNDGYIKTTVHSWPVEVKGNEITVKNWVRELKQTLRTTTIQVLTGWTTHMQIYTLPPPDSGPSCRVVDYGHGTYTAFPYTYIYGEYPPPEKKTLTGSVFDETTQITVYGVRQKLVGGKWEPQIDTNTGYPIRSVRTITGKQVTAFNASELKGYIPALRYFQEYDPEAGPDASNPLHPFNTVEVFTPLSIEYPDSLNPVKDDPNIPLIPTFNGVTIDIFSKHWPSPESDPPDYRYVTVISCDVWINPADYPHPLSQRLGYMPKTICTPPQVSIDPLFVKTSAPGAQTETYEGHFYASAMQMIPATKEVTKTVLNWSPDNYDITNVKLLKSYEPETDTTINASFTAKIKCPQNFKKTEKYVPKEDAI